MKVYTFTVSLTMPRNKRLRANKPMTWTDAARKVQSTLNRHHFGFVQVRPRPGRRLILINN